MRNRFFLLVALFITILPFITILGCGGGGGGKDSSSSELIEKDQDERSEYSAYVFAPSPSRQLMSTPYNLMTTTQEEGLLLVDNSGQAPLDYSPVVNCQIILPDGTTTKTNEQGRFYFSGIPFTTSEKGFPLIIDPNGSNYPQRTRLIIPLIIPRQESIPDRDDLHLIVKPASMLLSVGSKFLFHVYAIDSQGASYQLPANEVTWSFVPAQEGKNYGQIASNGLFRALAEGKGQVVAQAMVNSTNLSAYSEVEITDRNQVAQIYGQVTDSMQNPMTGVMIFVNGFENGTETGLLGNYLISYPPKEESLTLTFIYRGIVIKILENVTVNPGEAKEVNVTLDRFHEIGKIAYRLGTGQIEGQVIFLAEGLSGHLSIDEFPAAKELELLKVATVGTDIYRQMRENPDLSFSVIVEGVLSSSQKESARALPHVEISSISLLTQEGLPVQTIKGEVSWKNEQGYFQDKVLNNIESTPFTLDGLTDFPEILTRLQNSSDTWYPATIIGRVDYANRIISLVDIHFVEIFFDGQGDIYYDPEFLGNGAILMESSSTSGSMTDPNPLSRPYILSNVNVVSDIIYDLLISFPNKKFAGVVSGTMTGDFALTDYSSLLKVSCIQLLSDPENYLLHERGKIWRDEEGKVWFSPSFSLAIETKLYQLQGIEQFGDIPATLDEADLKVFTCFLSGEINDSSQEEIDIWQLELLGPVSEESQNGSEPKPDGIAYYVIDNQLPIGGRYLYQKLMTDGSIEDKLYELSNLRLTDQETADLLKAQPGLILQITLKYTDASTLSGQQTTTRTGPPRLLINQMSVLDDVDPILSISGNLIYHSWDNVLELVAGSPSFPEGTQGNFLLQGVSNTVLSALFSKPDRFIPVSGIIQVLQQGRNSIQNSTNDPLIARVLKLQAF